ncbi:MAG: alpha/beta fold hydrolase, partial [Saprospiraceae bacterium]|nr:alpha/beta fold hydrolase [Saprospiraceae bacterium]
MIIRHSSYPGAPKWQINGHFQTLAPSLLRRFKHIQYERERIETPDHDFLDLDWWLARPHQFSDRLILLSHGLEGSTGSSYILGMADFFHRKGWDVLAWNCRSCSGEMNRQFRMYHHGDTEDIHHVLQHAIARGDYPTVAMTGFSMGASITLKYLGTQGEAAPPQIKAAVVFSAPCNIAAGADVLDRWDNWLYKRLFLTKLSRKLRIKAQQFPGRIDPSRLKAVRRWRDFDEWFSAPICGYQSAADFHQQASSGNFVAGIRRPTLLISAANDPILTPECFPIETASEHPYFHFELTSGGGHCGFQSKMDKQVAWSEYRAFE